MSGSRRNLDAPRDRFQDYDIVYMHDAAIWPRRVPRTARSGTLFTSRKFEFPNSNCPDPVKEEFLVKQFYLIRHCKAAGQEELANLTAEGREQADALVHFLDNLPITYVISSPWVRAVDTIRPYCLSRQLTLHTDERLRERVLSSENYPDWQEKLKQSYEDTDLKFIGGESSGESMSRAIAVIQDLLVREETHIAVVTHGALMSLIIRYFNHEFGMEGWKSLSNPDVYKLDYYGKDRCEIKRIWN